MKSVPLLAELEVYRTGDRREARMRDRMAAFVRAHDDCFERSLSIGHVTGSAWIVDESLNEVILLHHRKLDRWLQPGGHADGDRDVRRVALREAREETGLTSLRAASPAIYDLDVHAIPARGAEAEHEHFDVRFAFFADRTEPIVSSDESHEVRWIPFERIEDYAIDESVRRLAAKSRSLSVRRG